MKDTENLHKHVQEMVDCYATTDPLREMSILKNDADRNEAAVKWLALAALHGVNQNASKITIIRDYENRVKVVAEYRDSELPSPGTDVGDRIFSAVREMTHTEEEKGKTAFALGMRDSSLDLKVQFKKKDYGEKITQKFPD